MGVAATVEVQVPWLLLVRRHGWSFAQTALVVRRAIALLQQATLAPLASQTGKLEHAS